MAQNYDTVKLLFSLVPPSVSDVVKYDTLTPWVGQAVLPARLIPSSDVKGRIPRTHPVVLTGFRSPFDPYPRFYRKFSLTRLSQPLQRFAAQAFAVGR